MRISVDWVDPDDPPELGAEWFDKADVKVDGKKVETDRLAFLQRKVDAARLSLDRGEGIPAMTLKPTLPIAAPPKYDEPLERLAYR